MANKILAILEQRDGILKRSAFEVVSTASELASKFKIEAEAVVIGNDVVNIDEIASFGINKITHLKSPELNNYSSSGYKKTLLEYVKETDADYLIFSNTSWGKDLAPRIAVGLDAGCLIDCTHLDSSSGELIATRPIYAGKAYIEVKCNSVKKVITIRPNVFKASKIENPAAADVTVKEITSPDITTRVVEFKKSEGKLDVAEADIIVSGGRGMKGPENFHLVEELADSLGAAVGASRAVVDAGWRPHREQVGQTGKTVSPSLYIACGISGAVQHLAGMSSSKYIVAINKDKDAPIFTIADYGIAGDTLEIIPVLIDEIKKLKSN